MEDMRSARENGESRWRLLGGEDDGKKDGMKVKQRV